jgi:hypothetical protein
MVMLALYYKWSVFYLFSKLLGEGIVRGNLFRKGHAGLLATIEKGADGVTVKPHVDLYSKAAMKRLLKRFDIVDVSVHQFQPDHFGSRVLGRLASPLSPALESKMGWYVAAKALKPNLA